MAWLFARSTGRRFLLRFEDLDANAVRQEAYAGQERDLAALGVHFDGAPVRQSDRLDVYRDVIADLQRRDRTYPCWCSRREIREAVAAPNSPVFPGAYPGTCRDISSKERRDKEAAGRPPALRLRTQGEALRFDDLLVGTVGGRVDDFVIRRGDGTPAYNLVVVIDDFYQAVDQVVRGDDLVPSTPRHLYTAALLGAEAPTYAHVGLVHGPGGERLAKRDGAVTMGERLAMGESVDDIRGLLAESLGLAAPGERPSIDEILRRFDCDELPRGPWVYDPTDPNSSS